MSNFRTSVTLQMGLYGQTLIKVDLKLYGMTIEGGKNNSGAIFQINTDGSDFQLLHSFENSGGKSPYCSIFISDSILYGMTNEGGNNDKGVIFALDLRNNADISKIIDFNK